MQMPSPLERPPLGKPATRETAVRTEGILAGASPDLFRRIREPEVELVVWRRQIREDLAAWLEDLPLPRMPHGRLLVGTPDLYSAVASLLHAARMPEGALRDAFLEDIVGLAQLFMDVMATPEVDIRLETIRHDACWKFHRDHVPARLLTTYRGPGTEWVHPRDGAAALSEQKSFRGRIERFPEHSVGLFKGSRGGSRAGIVHRSPPVALSGEVRLFLCLNLPSIVSPSSWLSTD